MPVIEVCLVPTDTPQSTLERLYDRIWEAIESVPDLGLTRTRPQDVTVLFPADLMKKGIGEYFLVRVSELTPKPERTDEVKKNLGEALKMVVLEFFPDGKFVEVIVKEASLTDVVVVYDMEIHDKHSVVDEMVDMILGKRQ